jgi:hypothetical protein
MPAVLGVGWSAALAPAVVRRVLSRSWSEGLPVPSLPEEVLFDEAFAGSRGTSQCRENRLKLTVAGRIE